MSPRRTDAIGAVAAVAGAAGARAAPDRARAAEAEVDAAEADLAALDGRTFLDFRLEVALLRRARWITLGESENWIQTRLQEPAVGRVARSGNWVATAPLRACTRLKTSFCSP